MFDCLVFGVPWVGDRSCLRPIVIFRPGQGMCTIAVGTSYVLWLSVSPVLRLRQASHRKEASRQNPTASQERLGVLCFLGPRVGPYSRF